MILKEVYIANFGKLCNFKYVFNNNLNCVYAENGYGKSTLATFIKVMLYDFQNKNSRDISKNERKKYMPWQGGKYGGYIIFEVDNQLFKLEKFFGRTEKDDTLNLYDLKTKKSMKMNSEIGEQLFKIDVDGFCKSIFFSENEILNFDNLSIQARLSSRIENSSDVNEYNNAIKVLDEKRKYYYKSGGNGKIADLKLEIKETENEIAGCGKSKQLVETYEKELVKLNNEILNLDNKKKEIEVYLKNNQRKLELSAKKEHLKSLELDYNNVQEKFLEVRKFFARYVPTNEEICEMENLEKDIKILEEKLNSILPNESDVLFYNTNYNNYINLSAKNIEKAINLAMEKDEKTSKFLIPNLIVSIVSLIIGICTINFNIVLSVVFFVLAIAGGSFFGFSVYKKQKFGNKQKIKDIKALLPNQNFNDSELIDELFNLKMNYEKWFKMNYYFNTVNNDIENIKIIIKEKQDKLNYFLINFERKENEYLSLQNIKSNFLIYNELSKELEEKSARINNFIKDNDIEVQNVDSMNSNNYDEILKTINNNLNVLTSNVLDIKQRLNIEQNTLCKLTEFERVRDNLLIQLDEAQKDYNIIVKTIEMLNTAKESLNSKFLSPMQNNFNSIIKKLNTLIVDNGTFDTELNLFVEYDGEYKSIEYFSQGYKKILDFATRIALIETIYSNEKPFIILDDCFISLDEINLKKINLLLKDLSNKYQIIYFICQKNRILK